MGSFLPRVMAIHDLAGFGRCSLANIMPVMSAMGVQVCPVPTAVLSTHTGGFDNIYISDYTEDMMGYLGHWKELNLSFDCIYTGFIGSEHQIDIIMKTIDTFSASMDRPFIVVDPVMADDGIAYSTYNEKMIGGMKTLCQKADVITPNFSEVCLLLDRPYEKRPLSNGEIKELLEDLHELGPGTVVMTGITSEKYGKINAGLSVVNENGIKQYRYLALPYKEVPVSYPGTGDIFASILAASLLRGEALAESMAYATDFIERAVRLTYSHKTPTREGVMFEKILTTVGKDIGRIVFYEL